MCNNCNKKAFRTYYFQIKGIEYIFKKFGPVIGGTISKADNKNSTEFYPFSKGLKLKLMNSNISMIPDL